MFYYLYQITNTVNGKIYVGVHKTKSLDDGYMGSGKIINRAITTHGIDNFEKVILEFFENQELMYAREKEIVTEEFLLREDVYNLRRGGLGGWDHENNNSEIQQRKAISGNKKQNWLRENDKEWAENKFKKSSIATKKRIEKGEIIGFMKPEIRAEMVKRAMTIKAREKRSKTFKERGHSQGKNNSQYGVRRIGINKDGKIRKILPQELEKYLNDGWQRGFKNKNV